MKNLFVLILASVIVFSCSKKQDTIEITTSQPHNVLNYVGSPDSASYRSSLAFSDQGAWFAYGFSDNA